MMKSRQEIKAIAKEAMGQQRGTAILLGIMVSVITMISVAIDHITLQLFGQVAYYIVFWLGMMIIYVAIINLFGEHIKIYKGEPASCGAIFSELAVNFLRKLGGMLWMYLWILLWSLLFVIPGYVKALAYSFAPIILADCPDVTARQALKVSMRITEGRKMDIFVFGLSWLGWFALSILTCGILWVVYVGPYYYTAYAGLYVEMREEALADGRITLDDLGIVESIPPVWDEN